MKPWFTTFITTSLLLLVCTASADVLLLDSITQAPVNSEEGLSRPLRGMTMKQVKGRFGEPSLAHPQVGKPPITRWDYPDYSVFFEFQYVLTSVVHRK